MIDGARLCSDAVVPFDFRYIRFLAGLRGLGAGGQSNAAPVKTSAFIGAAPRARDILRS
jgi:hypothetical protein